MTRPELYRLHKWVAVLAGVFFLSWMISGIVLILPGGKLERKTLLPDFQTATVSPAQAARTVGEPVLGISLIRVAGRLVYQVQTGYGSRLVDAHSGEAFPITLEVAEQVVRSEYLHSGATLEKERLERHDWTYRMGPLPVYRIQEAGSGEQYFISAQDGSIRKVTLAGRIRATIGSLHTFDVIPGIGGYPRVRKVALAGAASIGLGAVATGYAIALNRRRKAQAGTQLYHA